MTERPKYFERVQTEAVEYWKLLESNRKLVGPVRQLFEQVQNPRHVVSELLQNADDAGATMASVEVKDGEFVFTHNGKDFTKSDFGALCEFTGSNKRQMSTTGFRGIGFKSTFSLGDEVRLFTPSLSVMFHSQRFTEPVWIDRHEPKTPLTEVRVRIKDEHIQHVLQKNLDDWMSAPTSLLFFRGIRGLRIHDTEVRWKSLGRGPVADSKWWESSISPGKPYLMLRSSAEPYPSNAQDEIRKARLLGSEVLPPCKVDLVLGSDLQGLLFVILPTRLRTSLPFACNAPFMQDPERKEIKDPAMSPTNRWLLQRAGQLAGRTMLAWLRRDDLGIEQRCEAYRLLSDVDTEKSSLEDDCAAAVHAALRETIERERFLVTETGDLQPWNGCVAVPKQLVDVWSSQQIAALLGEDQKPFLSRHVLQDDVKKLDKWKCLRRLEKSEILKVLKAKDVTQPDTWPQLLELWNYVASEVIQYPSAYRDIRIFPVHEKNLLHAAGDVIRMGEKTAPDDLEFLRKYMLVTSQEWVDFLATQLGMAEQGHDEKLGKQVELANRIFGVLNRGEATEVNQVIKKASDGFFCGSRDFKDWIRLAHIAAALDATVPDNFQFVTRAIDGKLYARSFNHPVVADASNDLGDFVDAGWYEAHVLHENYSQPSVSCTKAQWQGWVFSGKSRLLTFVPLAQVPRDISGRNAIEEFLRERGAEITNDFPYAKSKDFNVTDTDFQDAFWQHWRKQAEADESFWGRLLARIFAEPHSYWSKSISCEVSQYEVRPVAKRNRHTRPITTDKPLIAAWIAKFRELPCLADTHGQFRRPCDLFRLTAETASLLSIEAFVRKDYDTEKNRPFLDALGVGTKVAGAGRLLDRLRGLATAPTPSIGDIENLYHRLDQLLSDGSAANLDDVHNAFAAESLILTAEKKWSRSSEVYLGSNDAEVAGAAVVHPSVRHLAMWSKIGVPNQPTVDRVLAWLDSLDSGQSLSENDLRQVRNFLPQHPERIWRECGHWLSLEGEWAPVESLSYAITDDSLIPWNHLYSQAKLKTADLRNLSAETCSRSPFVDLPRLADCVDDDVMNLPSRLPKAESKPWLTALGGGLRRIQRANQEDTDSIRELGKQLAMTVWQVVPEIEIVPSIDGQRVGNPRRAEAFWRDAVLYVADRAAAKMPKPIAGVLGRGFGTDILDAINFCYDRDSDRVMIYLEANFPLAPLEVMEPEDFDAVNTNDSDDEDDVDAATKNLLGDTPGPTPPIFDPTGPETTHEDTGAGASGAGGRGPNAGGYGSGGAGGTGGKSTGTGNGGKGSSGTKGHPSGKGSKRFISYIAADPNEEEPDPDGLQHEARMALEEKAIDLILAREPQLKRTPTNNPGFDLFEPNGDDEIIRRVEVKAMTGDLRGRPVGMSRAQFECAYEHREAYWLYVVEHADDPQTQIVRIKDPAGKARTFCFDHGWISVAEADGPETDEGDAAEETSDEVADVGRHSQEG